MRLSGRRDAVPCALASPALYFTGVAARPGATGPFAMDSTSGALFGLPRLQLQPERGASKTRYAEFNRMIVQRPRMRPFGRAIGCPGDGLGGRPHPS